MSKATDATLVIGQDGEGDDAFAMPQIPDVKLERELGRGGMGAVWLGRQELLDRPVAVKMMLVQGDQQFLDRFKREARILANLAHPNIVSCYHAGICDQGHPYMVMEFVDGPDLRVFIEEHGPISDAACLRIADEIATGLGHAYAQGIIHRDVKPENILLAPCSDSGDDFPYRAKVADLGLARPAICNEGSQALTAAGAVLGTPATMSPEQFDDPDNVDHRADIYGLGCILYHARCGKPAFAGKSLATLVASKVSGEQPDPRLHCDTMDPLLADLISRCLARQREDRPADWPALRALLQGDAPAQRSRLPLVPILLILILLGLTLATVSMMIDHDNDKAPADTSETKQEPNSENVTPMVSEAQGLQESLPLFGDLIEQRFKGWKLHGSLWDADRESSAIAVKAIAGAITRDLPAIPFALEGELDIGSNCNGFFVGIDCADDRHFGLKFIELGGSSSTLLGRFERDYELTTSTGAWAGDNNDTFRIEIHADRIVASVNNGEAFTLTLSAAPTAIRLYKQADDNNTMVRLSKFRARPLP